MTTPIFNAFLVPAGPHTVSVCFELNTDHPVLNPNTGAGSLTPDQWRKAVMDFPRVIHQIAAKIQIQDEKGKVYHQVSPPPYNLNAAKSLWLRFLGGDIVAGKQKLPSYIIPPLTRLPHQKIKSIRPMQTMVPGMYPAAPLSPDMVRKSRAAYPSNPPPNISISNYFLKIKAHPMVAGITDNLTDVILKGIERAHLTAIAGVELHNADLEKHYQRFIDPDTIHKLAEKHIERIKIDTESRDRVIRLFKKKIKTRILHSAVQNTPAYIHEAIDKLNSFNSARHFLGTTIDLKFTSLPDFETSIRIVTLNSLIKFGPDYSNYFDDDPDAIKTFVYPSFPVFKYHGLLVSGLKQPYSDFYEKTFIKLGSISSVISYESQSLSKNMAAIRAAGLSSGNPVLDTTGITVSRYIEIISATRFTYAGLLLYQAANRLLNIGRRYNNQLTDIHTKGHQLYITDPKWLAYNPADAEVKDGIHEHNVIRGYVVFVKITDEKQAIVSDWTSVTKVNEQFLFHSGGGKGDYTELPVHIDHAIQSVDDSAINTGNSTVDNDKLIQGITTGFMFNWDGTIISSRNPLRHYEKENTDETAKRSQRVEGAINPESHLTTEFRALHQLSKKILGIDYFPFQTDTGHYADFMILREYMAKKKSAAAQLKFSSHLNYQYILATQYLNGYCPVTEEMLRKNEHNGDAFGVKKIASIPAGFLRHEHINEVLISLDDNIYTDRTMKVSLSDHLGESSSDLVVRTGSITSNDDCIRYILPPPVPAFQTYLWYDYSSTKFMRTREMGENTMYSWYLRYQCEHTDAAGFDRQKADSPNQCCGCNAKCENYCGGVAQPPIYDGALKYLPDPIVTGFVIKVYADRECLLPLDKTLYPVTYCAFEGSYPDITPWKLDLGKQYRHADTNITVDAVQHILSVQIDQGAQLYAEIIPTFSQEDAQFYPNLIDRDLYEYSAPEGWYYNKLYTGIKIISLTHASQRPVFGPVIQSMKLTRFRTGTAGKNPYDLKTGIEIKFEQLNLWNHLPVPGTQPTGELDLFAVWDDYVPDRSGALKTIDQKINRKKDNDGFVYLGKIVFDTGSNTGADYASGLTGDPGNITGHIEINTENSFRVSYFTDAVFKIKNTSRYTRFFTGVDYNNLQPGLKEQFSAWSPDMPAPSIKESYPLIVTHANASLSEISATSDFLFNNTKPEPVSIAKIIPQIVSDEYPRHKKIDYRYNRVRIYFSSVPQTGKHTRVGIIVQDDHSIYQKFFSKNLSIAGRDRSTDRTRSLLNLSNSCLTDKQFNLDPTDLEPDYIKDFVPKYDGLESDQDHIIGLVSYVVQYDDSQKLFYIDIELNLRSKAQKELHNPFVQLNLVAYQPYSANYGPATKAIADSPEYFKEDYRLSLPIRADFFSIYPSRTFLNPLLLFKKHDSTGTTLSGDMRSLYYLESKKSFRTEFVVCVQELFDDDFWLEVPSEFSLLLYIINRKTKKQVTTTSNQKRQFYHVLLGDAFNEFGDDPDASFEVNFKLSFHKNIFRKYRFVVYEIDNYVQGSLNDEILTMGSGDFYKTTGIRPKDNFIFEQPEPDDTN